MDNVNFDSISSIFDNVNLHAKPMDSSTNGMDTRRDLQVKLLYQHQDQICQWITIIEHNRDSLSLVIFSNFDRQPTTVNVSWKSNQERIINLAFGA
ncbi:unnamed protein product [Rhizophagus irregularis]|nr:unnamed protein product [Rhizophagus irregularis]